MIIISVIIPVYNASKYLSDCLCSVISQSVTSLEIICINDGSTDDSLKILKQFQNEDERVKIIDQENQGVSAARNAGLVIAEGEFIGFVDADDTISPNFYETFLKFKDSDIVATTLSQNILLQKNKVYHCTEIQHEIFPYMLAHQDLNSVCVKLYKTEIIQKNQLFFPLGMKLGEDYHFNLGYLQFAKTMTIIDNNGYHYRENNISATRLVTNEAFFEKIFDEFEFNHKTVYGINLSDEIILNCKANQLVTSFIANLSLFIRKNPHLDYKTRKAMIKNYMKKLTKTGVLDNKTAIHLLNNGGFNRWILKSLQEESFIKIYLAYRYSHWRNGIK